MRLICFWCLLITCVRAQDGQFYTPQTFRQRESYPRPLFSPSRSDVQPQTTVADPWRGPAPVSEPWRERNTVVPGASPLPKSEPWRLPYALSKEQQASILHHKQSLSSDGAFSFEYASDNGLAAGEVIEPDGTRVGSYQYKDPSGQMVKLKYRAGKEGFQILEGSHLPKSPEPVAPQNNDNYYQQAYSQQRQQYDLQQQYNQQRAEPNRNWGQNQGPEGQKGAGNAYFVNNWRATAAAGPEDDGQILEGSHLPKSPEPVAPQNNDNYYQQAYSQQRQQYDLQQQYNQQRAEPNRNWGQNQGPEGQKGAGNAYFVNNWRATAAAGPEDDGQYRENEVDANRPHSFGEGYAFAFQG